MRRLNIFAKGNVDVRDSLIYSSIGGDVQWNGINEILRSRFPGTVARIHHETWVRSDSLVGATGSVPAEVRARRLPLGPYPAESQFSRRLFTTAIDVAVLSLQPDVTVPLMRHRRDEYLLYPYGWPDWSDADKEWARTEFESIGFLDVGSSMANLEWICTEIRARTGAHILLYNLSAVVPGEQVHCFQGLEETLPTRIRRFNLAAVELSRRKGISLVDVDSIIARGGADRLKLGPVHVRAEGHRLIAHEVIRILSDLGCFEEMQEPLRHSGTCESHAD